MLIICRYTIVKYKNLSTLCISILLINIYIYYAKVKQQSDTSVELDKIIHVNKLSQDKCYLSKYSSHLEILVLKVLTKNELNIEKQPIKESRSQKDGHDPVLLGVGK